VLLDLASYEENGVFLSLMALNAIDYLDEKAASELDAIKKLTSSRKIAAAATASRRCRRRRSPIWNGRDGVVEGWSGGILG
jgi:hypothetical protein